MDTKRLSFASYLKEQADQTVVFAVGRFQPITSGHEVLIKTVRQQAKLLGAKSLVFVSKSHDKNKNPLTYDQKIKFFHSAWPDIAVKPLSDETGSVIKIAKYLNKQGFKNIVFVAGSDRLQNFQNILHKYNGREYNLDSIKVIPAGEIRNPHSVGATGMSGTKMREAARQNSFYDFQKGIPDSLSIPVARDMFKAIRTVYGLKESLDLLDQELLREGVNDKAIFKAVFLAGGPGSGKDFVLQKTLQGHGLTEINSDKAFEFLLDRNELSKKMPDDETEKRNIIRARSNSITDLKQRLAIHGRQGLIINGTGDKPDKYKDLKNALEDAGYDTMMVFVNTDNKTSSDRNKKRGELGGREVPEHIRKAKWESAQNSKKYFSKLFGGKDANSSKFIEYDNSVDLSLAPESVRQAKAQEMLGIFRSVRKFSEKQPNHPEAKKWIENEQKRIGQPIEFRKTILDGPPSLSISSSDSMSKKPTSKDLSDAQDQHQRSGGAEDRDSRAARLARALGLSYMGFGRYGKEGKATHMSTNNGQQLAKLATVNENHIMKKDKINEEFSKLEWVNKND